MIRWIVNTSLRLRVVVVSVAAVLMIAGFRLLQDTPMDVFPEFAPPRVEIQTEAPGLSAQEVEVLVTGPIEQSLNGLPWLETIRSKSVLGLSSVVLFFQRDVDLFKARQMVQERLARISSSLPSVARPPEMLPPVSSTSRILMIGMYSDKFSQMELSTLARWTVRPRLLAVPGVANVSIWGERPRQLQILLHPDQLKIWNLSLEQIARAARDATRLKNGGFLDTPNQRMAVTLTSGIENAEDLAAIPVDYRNGMPLTLGALAELREGHPQPIGDAIVNDRPGILFIVEKQPWANTLETTRGIEEALEALRPALSGVELDPHIFRPASFIEMALSNLNRALLIGCVLVIIVLSFFLYNWRSALISAIALPTSLVMAGIALHYRGGTIDTMILAGLAIALGEVVDDAIIDVENILRRLRENRTSPQPRPVHRVVLEASLEVRSAVVFGSLIVVLVLMPVFFLPGLAGTFFQPLAESYILAILASLLVALTLTPALCYLLLPRAVQTEKVSPLTRSLRRRYEGWLTRILHYPKQTLTLLTGAFVFSLALLPFLGEEFLPSFKEYDFLMHWIAKPGTSIEAVDRITRRVSHELRSIPGVKHFGAHIGRAESGDEVEGPNFTELWISLDPSVDYQRTVSKIQQVVQGYPGLYRDVLTFLRERIKEVLTGTSGSVVVRLFGPDLHKLQEKAAEIRDSLATIPGIQDLAMEQIRSVPEVKVRIKEQQAAILGINPGMVREAVSTYLQGRTVGQVYQAQAVFDVVLWTPEQVRHNIEALGNLPLQTALGDYVPLKQIADIFVAPTPNAISHEGASRKIDLSCNVESGKLKSVVQAIEQKLQTIPFEPGYHPEILGEYQAQQAARNRLLTLGALCILGIFLILYTDFQSVRLSLLVLLGLPLALTGGILGVLLNGGIISLGSLVGFITVLGVAARNGIMLISHYRNLQWKEKMPFGLPLIIRGASERLSPILMTALTTALALLPIAISGARPGQEIEHPMALVILGGLITSTALNLVLLPLLYWLWGERVHPEKQ